MATSIKPKNELNRCSGDLGSQMHQCMTDLFPIHRSINGEGVRQTIRYLQQHLPVQVKEVPTGTAVFDWHVPQEWKLNDAYIADAQGNRIVDYAQSNLQIMSGSQPVRGQFTYADLQPHLLTLPAELDPNWIPYRTTFFREAWGFCISRNQLARLTQNDGEQFQVVVDAEFFDGSLTYGEATIAGQTDETILVYAHICHPSLANDNLSGVTVAAFFAKHLLQRIENGDVPRKTYKFVFAPATIGAITWLAQNESSLSKINGGLILSLLGDSGRFTYKQSREVDSRINRTVEQSFDQSNVIFETRRFTPFGYDERQFCSPGINLPIGCLMRTPNGEFPEYHTSGDNLSFVTTESLAESLQVVTVALTTLEQNEIPTSAQPNCEPQLGDRGLYRAFGQHDDRGRFQEAVMWVLNLADGKHDLVAISARANLPFELVRQAADVLFEHELLQFQSSIPSE